MKTEIVKTTQVPQIKNPPQMEILADSGKTWKVKSGPDGIVMKPQNPLLAGISASSEAMDNVLDNGVFIIPLKSLSDQRFENTPSSH